MPRAASATRWGARRCRILNRCASASSRRWALRRRRWPRCVSATRAPLHEVSILSFGLFGPNGPLPVHLTEYARERIYHHQDTSLSAFADLFHHRLALLFYRAWADAQPTVSLDRADNKRFEGYLASLIGMGQPGQMDKGSLSSHARFTHAGHLTRHGRDPEGLEKILRSYFKAPVSNWSKTCRSGCRSPSDANGRGCRAVAMRHALGSRPFWASPCAMCSHKFRIEIGPLSAEEYNRFLAGRSVGHRAARLGASVRRNRV